MNPLAVLGLATAAGISASTWGPLAYFAGNAVHEDKKDQAFIQC